MMDDEYLKRVFAVLTQNPTAQDLDFLIEAYARVGYLASIAEAAAAEAVNTRKHEEANEWLKAKANHPPGEKAVSDGTADKIAMVATYTLRRNELAAEGKAKKISNLLDALRECLWSIRHLGKYDSAQINLPVSVKEW